TDITDVTARTIALHLGMDSDEATDKLIDPWWRSWMFEKLGDRADHIEWIFDSVITGPGAGERLNAFAEVHGQYPHLMVLDNLQNGIETPADEYAQVKEMMTSVQKLARATKAHIAVLHHVKGEYSAGTKPVPLSGGLQNPFAVPEVGLTFYRPDEGHRIAINI